MSKQNWHYPECDSENIYYHIGASSDAPFMRDANLLQIAKGLFPEAAPLDIYVCGDCGAVRTFVSEQEALKRITEIWPRLNE
jgi:hypothetical protein